MPRDRPTHPNQRYQPTPQYSQAFVSSLPTKPKTLTFQRFNVSTPLRSNAPTHQRTNNFSF